MKTVFGVLVDGIAFAFFLGMCIFFYNSTKILLTIYCVLFWALSAYPIVRFLFGFFSHLDEAFLEMFLTNLVALVALVLANNYMLYLVHVWAIDIGGWRQYSLAFWNITLSAVFEGKDPGFAVLGAPVHPSLPVSHGIAFLFQSPAESIRSQTGSAPALFVVARAFIANLGLGVLSGILSTLIVRHYLKPEDS